MYNPESIQIPDTPEYKEDIETTHMLQGAKLELYDEDVINQTECLSPGFIQRRKEKIEALPEVHMDDFLIHSINRITTAVPGGDVVMHRVRKKEFFDAIKIDGQIETPKDVLIFLSDLCSLMPNMFKQLGAKHVKVFSPDRFVIIDPENSKSKYAENLLEARSQGKTRAAYTSDEQFVYFDVKGLRSKARFAFAVLHESVHAYGFSSEHVTDLDDENKKIKSEPRRFGLGVFRDDVSSGKLHKRLLGLNEAVTEALAEELCRKFYDIFPFMVQAVNDEVEIELEKNKEFENQVGEPSQLIVEPYSYKTGFRKNWNTTVDLSNPVYGMYIKKYREYFMEKIREVGEPESLLNEQIQPQIKNAYLNGEWLSFFRTLKKIGISPDDLIKKDEEIVESLKRLEAGANQS